MVPAADGVLEVLDFAYYIAYNLFEDENNVLNEVNAEEYLNKMGQSEYGYPKHSNLIFNGMIIVYSMVINGGYIQQSIYDKVAETLHLFYNVCNGVFASAVKTLAFISTRVNEDNIDEAGEERK